MDEPHDISPPADVPDEVAPPVDAGYAPAETAILGGLLDEAMGRDTEDGADPHSVEDRVPPIHDGE
jgi:hypothetical protein